MSKIKLKKVLLLTVIVALLVLNATTSADKSDTQAINQERVNTNEGTEKVTDVDDSEKLLKITTSSELEFDDIYDWVKDTLQCVYAGETVTYTNAAQVDRLVQTGYSWIQKEGPYSITQGSLVDRKSGSETPVYLIAISGANLSVPNQTTDLNVCILAACGLNNKYLQNIKKTMLENIPTDSNIIVAGHSLGGTVGQQVVAETKLKKTYNFLNTVTFGSPLIKGFSREGTIKRLGDIKDRIPYYGISTILNICWQTFGLNKEDGGYKNRHNAHAHGYQREDVWGDYDVTGQKNGSKSLVLDYSTTKFYQSLVKNTD